MYCEIYPSLRGNTEEFDFSILLLRMIYCDTPHHTVTGACHTGTVHCTVDAAPGLVHGDSLHHPLPPRLSALRGGGGLAAGAGQEEEANL